MTLKDNNISAGDRDPSRFGMPKVETNVYDVTQENLIRIVDEVAKIQPQYSQSLSIIQLDYIQSIKNAVSAAFHELKQMSDIRIWNGIYPNIHFTENFAKQSEEITRNAILAL